MGGKCNPSTTWYPQGFRAPLKWQSNCSPLPKRTWGWGLKYDSMLTLAWPSHLPNCDLKSSCCIYYYYYIIDFQHLLKKSGQEYEEWLSTCGIHFYTSSIVLQKRINHLRSQCILPLRAPDVSSAFQNEESSLCPPGKDRGRRGNPDSQCRAHATEDVPKRSCWATQGRTIRKVDRAEFCLHSVISNHHLNSCLCLL